MVPLIKCVIQGSQTVLLHVTIRETGKDITINITVDFG